MKMKDKILTHHTSLSYSNFHIEPLIEKGNNRRKKMRIKCEYGLHGLCDELDLIKKNGPKCHLCIGNGTIDKYGEKVFMHKDRYGHMFVSDEKIETIKGYDGCIEHRKCVKAKGNL